MRPTPRDVVKVALAVDLDPGAGPTALDARADLIVGALQDQGLLPPDDPGEPTAADLDAAARYLAHRSQHPRFVHGDDGWRKLLAAAGDVEMAAAQAARNVPQSEQETVAQAKALLLAAAASRRASQGVAP